MADVYLRREILNRMRARLQRIRKVNGFETEAGLYVTLGRLYAIPEIEMPRLALVPADEVGTSTILAQGQRVSMGLYVLVEGMIAFDAVDPLAPAESLVGDIKLALFDRNDQTLGFDRRIVEDLLYADPAGRYVDREAGAKWVAVQVGAFVKYAEGYGAPKVTL